MSLIKKITVILILSLTAFNLLCTASFANEEPSPVIYRDLLTSCEVDVYDTFLKNAEKMKDGISSVKIYPRENIQKDEIGEILQKASAAFVLDHPECFWISYEKLSFTYIDSPNGVSEITAKKKDGLEYYYPSAYTSPEQVENDFRLINEKSDEIIKNAEKYPTVYEKVRYFHDHLCKNNVYNEYVKNGEDDKADLSAWGAVSALASDNDPKKGPVCEGYAKAFKILCDKAGIPCALIPGDGITEEKVSAPHMWCAVMISEKWYGVDITWDDGVINGTNVMRDNYFLVGNETENFSQNHIPNVKKYFETHLPTPTLEDEKYSFKKGENSFIEISDISAVYGEKAEAVIKLKDHNGEAKDGEITLYKTSVSEKNKLGVYKTVNGICRVNIDTSLLSVVNDKKIVAVCTSSDGIMSVASAVCSIAPKELMLDSSDVKIMYSENIPYLSGNVVSKTGEKITYTVKSEVSEDKKKITVYYTDITSIDLNCKTPEELTLEFELASDSKNTYLTYIYIAAVIIVSCLMLSLLKRK